MHRNIEKSLRIFITAYIAVLFAVILPLHTHHDNDEHDDCPICLLADQPVATAATTFFVVIITALPGVFFSLPSPASTTHHFVYQTRAPPLTTSI